MSLDIGGQLCCSRYHLGVVDLWESQGVQIPAAATNLLYDLE